MSDDRQQSLPDLHRYDALSMRALALAVFDQAREDLTSVEDCPCCGQPVRTCAEAFLRQHSKADVFMFDWWFRLLGREL